MDQGVQQNNMISNLPLLFANGYPTSLEKISENQLENFIPFMVQCSLGHINLQGKVDCSEPEWWPEDLTFTCPFTKPRKLLGNWMIKMKEIVMICYQFHKSSFLLRFCNDLASYEHASLRFINNYNSTTSLFDRRSNKLLVTFRNENMSYDQPQRIRKCLLQQKSKNGCRIGQELQQMMVEPAPFDIYLCDNCDAELYSQEAFQEHEKICSVDEHDVILCDTPEPVNNKQVDQQINATESNELHIGFMLNFNLKYRYVTRKLKNFDTSESPSLKEENRFMIVDRDKRMPRRNRAVHSLTRCPTIPLSSPAGQTLLRTTKTMVSPEYLSERLDRVERFCHAPLLSKLLGKPKYLERKCVINTPHCTFKKPQDYSSHVYIFPRRQFSQRRRTENFLFLNSPLIKRCRPISVRLKKISDREMKGKQFISSPKINIKLTRDTSRSSNWKISSPATEIIIDTIDLCSSDEDEKPNFSNQSTLVCTHTSQSDPFFSKYVGTNPVSQLNVSRMCLKKINSQLNSSEVSLIPIHRVFGSRSTIPVNSSVSSSIKIVSSTSDTTTNNKGTTSLYQGNVVLSPSVTTESSITLPKPLRPSVYIFSNYTTINPLTAFVTNEIISDSGDTNFDISNSNQENQIQSAMGSSIVSKHNAIGNTTSTQDWFPSMNALASNSLSGANNINSGQNHSVDHECASKSLSLMQSFGSNGISIDLTS